MSPSRNYAAVLLASSLAWCGAAVADDYRFDVRLTGEHADRAGLDDFDAVDVRGTFYLEPVRTDGLPLAEAAFLNRSSFATANATRIDGGGEVTVLSGSLGYYVPNTIFFGRIGVTNVDYGPANDRTWNGTFGVTPFDGLLLTTNFDEDGWDPNVSAKYVGKLANSHYYALSASAVDPDGGDTSVGIDFDYFFDLTFKVGAGFNSGNDRFTVRAEKFITPSFSVAGALYSDDDSDGVGAQVAWRF